MNQFKTTQRTCARLSISLTVGALLATGISTPSQAAITAPTPTLNSSELIDSLIVKYEPGAAVVDKTGNPNGEAAVTENVDLAVGESIGLGYRTINLDQPIPVAEAQAVAVQLAGTSAIATAEPNYAISIENVDSQLSAATTQSLPNSNGANPNIWGLDRLDQATRNFDNSYNYFGTGVGVNVYIVDSGVKSTHSEFQTGSGTRVQTGYTTFTADPATTDCNGHGTHVAGITAGNTYGVAKSATIIPVKVLSCAGSGDSAKLISGINWIISNHVSGQPAVANFSLGSDTRTGRISSVDDAMSALIADGVLPAVASGNNTDDACYFSPANSPGPISVSAATSADGIATFSNYGTCTDIYAPGQNIYSAGIADNNQVVAKSGTSMAAPFVTGVLANILQENPSATLAQAWAMVTAEALSVMPDDGRSSPRLLLHQPTTGWSSSSLAEQARLRVVATEVAAAEAKAVADAEAARIAAEKAAADAIAAEIASRTINTKTKYSARVLAGRVGVPYTSKATVTLTVAKASKKICSLSGTKLRTLKSGNCVVTIKVQEPKPKKGKRPAATKTVKTFIVQ